MAYSIPPAICRSKPCKIVKNYFFNTQLLHAHLQYVCSIPAKYFTKYALSPISQYVQLSKIGIGMKRICSKTQDYEKHRQELKTKLRKRGYSGKFIETQLQKVDRLNRQDLLVYPPFTLCSRRPRRPRFRPPWTKRGDRETT